MSCNTYTEEEAAARIILINTALNKLMQRKENITNKVYNPSDDEEFYTILSNITKLKSARSRIIADCEYINKILRR